MTFSEILSQVRSFIRADSDQWSNQKITYSVNNALDTITGYAIGADRKFQWDDTNHTKMPVGTTNLVANQSEYSFLTDQQGNQILTLTRIEVLGSDNIWHVLQPIDIYNISEALDEFMKTAGTPLYYDKSNDNVIRLYPAPSTSISNGLKFYFQRTASYFESTDTTKEPGCANLLHRYLVISAAYDAAITMGLKNLSALQLEMAREEEKMRVYFDDRNKDEPPMFLARKTYSR